MIISAFVGAYGVSPQRLFILAHGWIESAGPAIGASQNTSVKGLWRPRSRGMWEGFTKNDIYERVHLQHSSFLATEAGKISF